jgi:hypothetical protein
MIHFCICGGHDGDLSSEHRVCITVFGACELRLPTLAKRLLEQKHRRKEGLPKRSHFFITLCGATELKSPTMAEEFIALQDAVDSGALTLAEYDDAIGRLNGDTGIECGSFTMMGAFSNDALPAENEEVDGLAINRHLGRITDEAGATLEMGVGQKGSQRSGVLRKALHHRRQHAAANAV